MIGCLRTRVRKQPIIALYFEFENDLKFYNLGARSKYEKQNVANGGRHVEINNNRTIPIRHRIIFLWLNLIDN